MIGPRNMLTNPPKRGVVGKNTSFGGQVPYIEDDYNRPKKMAVEERLKIEETTEKVHNGKKFSQQAKKTHLFNTNR